MGEFRKMNNEHRSRHEEDFPPLLRAPAQRSAVPSFIVMDVMREAADLEAAGQSIIHMEVGQPGTPAPQAARDAVRNALETDYLGYTLALGTAPLRERLAQHYCQQYGIDLSPERIIVTTGSSGAFVLSFLALFDAGTNVLLPSPGYPCYRHILTALGCNPLLLPTGPQTRWMPTVDAIANAHAAQPLGGILIASPANPTGTVIEPDRLAEIAAYCREQKIWLVSDEIYHGLTYGGPCASALEFSDDVIVINSFSKYFSMTGWRVGWMIVPPGLVRAIERLQQNLFISPPAVAQIAAMGAFSGTGELEANKDNYAANRALLLEELPKAGLDRIAPADGAFYLYVDVSRWTDDSRTFAKSMLEETGIAATPGVDFDAERGNRFVRFSYAGRTEDIAEAARRLKKWGKLA
jgi:aspartate/methionine/tyrosine aminotransferase